MRTEVLALITLVSAASAEAATVITFNDLGPGASVTTQYAAQGVLFSTRTGTNVFNAATSTYGAMYGMVGGSLTNSRNGGSDRQQFLVMDFTSAVSGLSFNYTNYGGFFSSNNFRAYDAAGALLETLAPGWASANGAQLISFASTGIRKVELRQPTSGWIFGVDNVSFTVDPLPAVPEPATWAMLILGFGFVGAALRRRPIASVSN